MVEKRYIAVLLNDNMYIRRYRDSRVKYVVIDYFFYFFKIGKLITPSGQ